MTTKAVSLATTVAITGVSRRTWWRRISAGSVKRIGNDPRGNTLLCWADVLPHVCISLDAEGSNLVLRADAGDAEAQNELGQLFFVAEKYSIAHFWLQQAVQQDHPDAMQWLACCYAAGRGVPRDENLALMWLAKAAAHGSVIAQAQMRGLRDRGALRIDMP